MSQNNTPSDRAIKLRGDPANVVSPRESEVMRLKSEGLSVKQIAGQLGISWQTVKVHLRNARSKGGTDGR